MPLTILITQTGLLAAIFLTEMSVMTTVSAATIDTIVSTNFYHNCHQGLPFQAAAAANCAPLAVVKE
jgi:hypothetical protein